MVRRPRYMGAEDIGSWGSVISLFSWLSLPVNVAILIFTNAAFRDLVLIPFVASVADAGAGCADATPTSCARRLPYKEHAGRPRALGTCRAQARRAISRRPCPTRPHSAPPGLTRPHSAPLCPTRPDAGTRSTARPTRCRPRPRSRTTPASMASRPPTTPSARRTCTTATPTSAASSGCPRHRSPRTPAAPALTTPAAPNAPAAPAAPNASPAHLAPRPPAHRHPAQTATRCPRQQENKLLPFLYHCSTSTHRRPRPSSTPRASATPPRRCTTRHTATRATAGSRRSRAASGLCSFPPSLTPAHPT